MFLALLRCCPLTRIEFETALIRLRPALATAFLEDGRPPNLDHTLVAVSLAEQCILNEYVYQEDQADRERIAGLEQALAKLEDLPETSFIGRTAALACYRPLANHPLAERIIARAAGVENMLFQAMLARQIRNPRIETGIMATIAHIGTIDDEISGKVRAQYEESPYPRWQMVGRGTPGLFHETLAAQLPDQEIPDAARALTSPRVLLAGCGTGRQCILASDTLQDASITAIDLSRRSLAYAIRKCRQAEIGNIEFFQADILALTGWEQRFDIIESTGVLHHMQDPLKGWNILADLLEPGGFMKIGLYSRHARTNVQTARDQVIRDGYPATTEGIRRYRSDIISLPPEDPAREIAGSSDFFTLSACRDLVFHVQEHQFTIPEIATMLDRLQLRFLGFQFPRRWQRHRFAEKFQNPGAARDLTSWAAFEEAHPAAFGSMYVFWCQKE